LLEVPSEKLTIYRSHVKQLL